MLDIRRKKGYESFVVSVQDDPSVASLWLSKKEGEELAYSLLDNCYDLFYYTDKKTVIDYLCQSGLISEKQHALLMKEDEDE